MILDLNTSEGQDLKNGWHDLIQTRHLADQYWDASEKRWVTCSPATFNMIRSTYPRSAFGFWRSDDGVLNEVLNSSQLIRAFGNDLAWSPYDGYWYFHQQRSVPKPPPRQPPDWVQKMNAELAQIDASTALSPAEREHARLRVIDSFTPAPAR